jgi:hypothetical protein
MSDVWACDGRLDNPTEYRTYICTLAMGHELGTEGPMNHEAWADGELMAEWADESAGAWREKQDPGGGAE